MNAVALRFYVHHTRRHAGALLFEWLLESARKIGIPGGSAFQAVAGFGRHGVIHEQRFFELAADLPVMVEFIVTPAQADQLIEMVRAEKIQTCCTRTAQEVILL